ncbi:hypothetical protein N7510_006326 [Penicillium lagena]|uniref:uncharacterized protein n=1 Tax=Penicillium lagena TaxID=94218 RepID=UPI0025406BDF|nr:uncharacterized protein N7510_006326 [Penicillium lagena]KAJ5613132.1 hypothetical protein N7510_006326 [Penicillium lagena]
MDSWRERGFVPDSDEEDEFDSLDSKKGNLVNDTDGPTLAYIAVPSPNPHAGTALKTRREDTQPESASKPHREPVEASQDLVDEVDVVENGSARMKRRTVRKSTQSPLRIGKGRGSLRKSASSGLNTPKSSTPRSIGPKETQKGDDVWSVPSSSPTKPLVVLASARKSSREKSSATKPSDTIWDIPSSSDEEYGLPGLQISPKLPTSPRLPRSSTAPPKIAEDKGISQITSATDSPLSSPPSSFAAQLDTIAPDADMETPSVSIPLPNHNLDDMITDLDIPEEVLRELSQPARRSLRERNPIQLHPYLLEQAQYQTLMKARGVRPVRIAIEQQLRKAAQESQDQDQAQDSYDPDAPPSSPPAEEYLPPPRREPHSEGQRNRRNEPLEHQRQHVVKRRKISRSDTYRRQHDFSRPRMTMDHNTSLNGDNGLSIYNIPPSPPRSGSASTITRTPRTSGGFRWPIGGSSPPPEFTTLAATEPKSRIQEEDGSSLVELPVPIAKDNEETQSDTSRSQQSSDAEEESDEEDHARRMYQRRIKGVLPASWLRLDQKKQQGTQTQAQRDRHAALQRTESAKGVARKIVRKSNPSGPSSPYRHRALIDFEDSDGDEDDNNEAPRVPEKDDTDERLANFVGFEDPYGQDEDDIPEDNRIDGMFAPVPRKSSSSGGQKQKTLKRQKPKGNDKLEERQRKRARLKRQTRLTDTSYGGRRTKQSTKVSVPKLGILDAPDVAQRPPKEQPQFLRVAARKARARKEGGRQSPTRKFFQLATRKDTADANESLRRWEKGAIRQTKINPPQVKPRKRGPQPSFQSLINQARPHLQSTRTSQHATIEPSHIALPPDERAVPEQGPRYDPAVPAATSTQNAAVSRPSQPEKRGHQWVVRRNVAITSLRRNDPRPAAGQGSQPSSAHFHKSLSMLNRNYRHQPTSKPYRPSLTLDRYLTDNGSNPATNQTSKTAVAPQTETRSEQSTTPLQPSHRRLKKRTPNRINLDSDGFYEQQEPAAIIADDPTPTATPAGHARPSFQNIGGLFNWQRSYSVDFGIMPLQAGTFFHESTFIGSGEFARSLDVLKRDLDRDAGHLFVHVKDQSFRWGAWNDMVSSDMGHAFDAMIVQIESNTSVSPDTVPGQALDSAVTIYRSLIKYVTSYLTFMDPVDRTAFVTRAQSLISKLRDSLAPFCAGEECNKSALVKVASYGPVFANQVYQIATHSLVDNTLADELLALVNTLIKDVGILISDKENLSQLQRFLDENKKTERRECGIREDFPLVEAYVITKHLVHSSERYCGWFKDMQTEACINGGLQSTKDVGILENGWRGLFTVLPLNEIDQFGILRRGSRFQGADDNWKLVKQLLSPVLDHADANSVTHTFSFNTYCRTVFHRCYHLLSAWGWRDCKPILDTLYDFFARKTLYNLKLEETFGSPSFLDELDGKPSLHVRPGEPCFHTLLKIIARGLPFLTEKFPKKKILGFVWRLLPNHGRVYPKEQELRHEDLDALRNHHDLLSTLYWAAPEGCRPRLDSIRNLVDPARSHRETCSISLRSWARLVRFKLSTNEDLSDLVPFADWHGYFVTELLKQRSLARTEIESQSKGNNQVSKELIEKTIAQNQRHIESLLNTALNAMKVAVELAPSLDHAHQIISRLPFELLLGLFDPKLERVNVVVSGTLQVIIAYIRKDKDNAKPPAAVSTEDDSQEYGDWTAIEAAYGQETSLSDAIKYVENVCLPAVAPLVSNCFGADHCPEDAILVNVVDCWTSIAQILVRYGLRHWETYLDRYDGLSWANLLSTIQTRKFTPQFVASCIEKDSRFLFDCRLQVLEMWMSSLVERSSMLKFQHRLTEALLNESPNDPLLENLPFFKDHKNDQYAITLEEFGQRRLSLISSLLSNMREHLQVMNEQLRNMKPMGSRDLDGQKRERRESLQRDINVTKQGYRELLQRLMTAMKKNYQELGNATEEPVQGAYIDFVHRVIQFLQQYTSDIEPIDQFFTNPSSFPLPSTDPLYIVAKLKAYETKLSSDREVKTLTMFIQSISERAAIDGEQSYLVEQLHTSMKDTFEAGIPGRPTLRATLLQCVFPAYLELAFSNGAAWLLSRPIIQTVTLLFKDLLCNIDTADSACVLSIATIFTSVFRASHRALRSLSTSPERFNDSAVLSTLSSYMDMFSSSLIVLDYIDRIIDAVPARIAVEGPAIDEAIDQMRWFRDFAQAVIVTTSPISTNPTTPTVEPGFDPTAAIAAIQPPAPPGPTSSSSSGRLPAFLPEAARLAGKELQSYLASWSRHQGKYYITRRGAARQQEVTLESRLATVVENAEEARRGLDVAARWFLDRVKGLELLD